MSILYLIFLIFSVSCNNQDLQQGRRNASPQAATRSSASLSESRPASPTAAAILVSISLATPPTTAPSSSSNSRSGNVVLPISARATVQEIDYTNQVIRMSVVNGSCLPDRVPEASSSPSPSEFYNKMMHADAGVGYTLFNCSGEVDDWGWAFGPIRCLGRGNFRVYAYRSSTSFTERPFLSRCVKMYNVSQVSEVTG